MKTKAKKLVTLILTALLVLSILPMNVFAAPIDADSTASIKINYAVEKSLVTLSTCHPYPYNYQRYLVYAELVEN